MVLTDAQVLALHKALVEIPSVSHQEERIASFVEGYLRDHGAHVTRIGNNVTARAGQGPRLVLNSHLDTVPPSSSWSHDPWGVRVEAGRIHGLGSNDAKAAVAGMMAAFLDVVEHDGPCEVLLLLASEEETGGQGTEHAWPKLRDAGFRADGVVVGEPTGLDIVTAQKGLLVLELIARGTSCHSANARALGATNAIRTLAEDIVALAGFDAGAPHPTLGMTTLEPTMLQAGERRNVLPDRASAYLDLRTVPTLSHAEWVARVATQVRSDVRVHSDRLEPYECSRDAAIVAAAARALPGARVVGSATMSDLVFFRGIPAIKCGPGQTARSHTADEYVTADEVEAGARFYRALIDAFAEVHGRAAEPAAASHSKSRGQR